MSARALLGYCKVVVFHSKAASLPQQPQNLPKQSVFDLSLFTVETEKSFPTSAQSPCLKIQWQLYLTVLKGGRIIDFHISYFLDANGHTDIRTDGRTDGRTDPHIEMRGRVQK